MAKYDLKEITKILGRNRDGTATASDFTKVLEWAQNAWVEQERIEAMDPEAARLELNAEFVDEYDDREWRYCLAETIREVAAYNGAKKHGHARLAHDAMIQAQNMFKEYEFKRRLSLKNTQHAKKRGRAVTERSDALREIIRDYAEEYRTLHPYDRARRSQARMSRDLARILNVPPETVRDYLKKLGIR